MVQLGLDSSIQHNLQVGPGPAGVAALIQNMPPDASVNTIRVFEDGDYVFAHTEYNFHVPSKSLCAIARRARYTMNGTTESSLFILSPP
jgi:predicted SnoaL-like aldol condensation-catalyzing enzyme